MGIGQRGENQGLEGGFTTSDGLRGKEPGDANASVSTCGTRT